MHFSTFLKLLTQSTADKIRDLERYASPGGFDFYRSSRDGVVHYCAHGRTRIGVASDIKQTASENGVEHNLEIFDHVANWVDKQNGELFAPNRGVWKSPGGNFSVHIEPEIGIQTKQGQDVVAVYPRKEPRLTRDVGGAGVVLLSQAYRAEEHTRFGILDAYGQRVTRAKTNVSEAILRREIETIDSELQRILG